MPAIDRSRDGLPELHLAAVSPVARARGTVAQRKVDAIKLPVITGLILALEIHTRGPAPDKPRENRVKLSKIEGKLE